MRKALFIIGSLAISAPVWGEVGSMLTFPGGSNSEVQFNCEYLFCGDSTFTFSTTTKRLTTSNVVVTTVTFSDGSVITSSGSLGMAIGSTVAGGTEGSVLFLGASGALNQDNSNLFWNNASNRLGVGTNSPSQTLDVAGSGTFQTGVEVGGNLHVFGTSALDSSVTVGTLTSGRVVTAGASGLLQDHSGLQFNSTSTLTVGDNSDDAKPGIVTIRAYDGLGASGSPTLNLFGTATTEGPRINFDGDDAGASINAKIVFGPSSLFSGSCGSGELCIASDGSLNSGPSIRFGATTMLSLAASGVTSSTNVTVTGQLVGLINAEASGTTLTTVEKLQFIAAGCNNATAATMLDLPTSNAPAAACRTGSNFQKGVLDFDMGTDESAYFGFRLPSDWSGAVDASFVWSSSTTETNAAVWGIQVGCAADNESDDPSMNTASTVTDAYGGTSAAKAMIASVTGITTTGCAAGEYANFRVYRDANDAADTLTGDARLFSVELTLRRAQ